MILVLTLIYVAVLLLLVKLKVLKWTLWVKLSPIAWMILLLIFMVFPLQFTSPAGNVLLGHYSVQIIPNVAGQVTEVPVQPNLSLKKGDVLFQIEPRPFQAAVDQLSARLQLAKTRLEQSHKLAKQDAGSQYEVENFESQFQNLKAQLDNAKFNLEQTTVRAPADGYVTNVALRPGDRVVSFPLAPAMAFFDDSVLVVGVQIHQIFLRHIEPGQEAEVTLKMYPGKIFKATVEYVEPAIATGYEMATGFAIVPQQVVPAPFWVRLKLEDEAVRLKIPPGMVGTAAIYTGKFNAISIIRRVMIRTEAFMNFVIPF